MTDDELPGVSAELADLREHWNSAYIISADTAGLTWTATRRDGQGSLTESTAQDLRARIRDDYDARPVTRRRS
jgi:hypothetical protein